MATVTVNAREAGEGHTYRHTWTSLGNGDQGSAVSIPGAADRTVQMTGTFSVGGTVILQGSTLANPNEATDDDWFTLTDFQGNALSFTAAGGELVQEVVTWLRPKVTGGDGSTDITCTILSRSTMR